MAGKAKDAATEVVSFKKKAKKAGAGGRKRARRRVEEEEATAVGDAGEAAADAEAPVADEQIQRTIEEVREDQRLRAQLLRGELERNKPSNETSGVHHKKAKKAAPEAQQYGLHDPKKDGSANQKLMTLLDGQFTGQSASSERDQHEELMNKYIEEKLQKQRPASDVQGADAGGDDAAAAMQRKEDALFALPAHLKPDVPGGSSGGTYDEGEGGGILMGNAGIAEVELPASYAERTERATRLALEANRTGGGRHNGVGGLASSALPANFSTDFNRHRSDYVAGLKNMHKDDQRERGFRKLGKNQASDDRAVSRFRKFESRRMRR